MGNKTKEENIKFKKYYSYFYVLLSFILIFNLFLIYDSGIFSYSDNVFTSVIASDSYSVPLEDYNKNIKIDEKLLNKDKGFTPNISKELYRNSPNPKKLSVITDDYYDSENKKFKKVIGNDLTIIKSEKENIFNLDTSIFNERFISIDDYEIKSNDSLIEVIMYVGLADGTELALYKDSNYKIGENYSKVVETGVLLDTLIVKDGYVSFFTNSFSAFYVTFPPVNMLYEQSKRIYIDDYVTNVDIAYINVMMYFNDIGYQTITSNPLLPMYNNWDAEKFYIETWKSSGRDYLQLVSKTNDLINYPLYLTIYTNDYGNFYQTILWTIRENNLPVQKSSFLPVYTKVDDNLVLPMSNYFDYYSYIMVEYLYDDLINPPINYLFYGTKSNGVELFNVTTPHYYPLEEMFILNGYTCGANFVYDSVLGVSIEYTMCSYDVNVEIYHPYVASFEPNFYRNITIYACNEHGCIDDTFDVNITKSSSVSGGSNVTGLVSYYEFDGNANDLIGENDGILVNSPTNISGILNSAYSFDGVNQRINISDDDNLDFGTGDFMINFWSKTNIGDRMFISKINGAPTYTGWGIISLIGANLGKISIYEDDSGSGSGALGTANISTGDWKMITLGRDGTNISVWVDGVYDFSVTSSANLDNTHALTLGYLPFAGFSKSSFDELLIIKGEPPTQEFITELYNSGNALGFDELTEETPIEEIIACDYILTQLPSNVVNNYAVLNGNYYGNLTASVYFLLREYGTAVWNTIATRTLTSPQSFTSEDMGPVNLGLVENKSYEYRAVFDYNETSYSCNSKIFSTGLNSTNPSLFTPTLLKQPSNMTLYHNTTNTINIKEYLAFYDSLVVIFEDTEGLQSILLNEGDSFENIYFNITLPESDDIILRGMLRIETFSLNNSFNIKFIAKSVLQNDTETNYFTITITEPLEETIFSNTIDFIYNIFPDADTLTLGQRMTYVVGIMIVTALVLLLIAGSVGSGVPVLMLYIIAFLEFFLFIYFIAIGYIPIIVWILLLLIVLSLSYFKFFHNSGG